MKSTFVLRSRKGRTVRPLTLALFLPLLPFSASTVAEDVSLHRGFGPPRPAAFSLETSILRIPAVRTAAGVFQAEMQLVDKAQLIFELSTLDELSDAILPGLTSPPSEYGSNGLLRLPAVRINGKSYEADLSLLAGFRPPRFKVDTLRIVQAPAASRIREMLEDLRGIFLDQGTGRLIERDPAGLVNIYDVTGISCQVVIRGVTLDSLLQEGSLRLGAESSDTFTFRTNGSLTTQHYRREPALPAPCVNGEMVAGGNAVLNFDIFWQTFEEHYPFFELAGIDWEQTKIAHRSQVTSSTTDAELFQILRSMVEPTADPHVQINSPFGRYNAGTTPEYLAASNRAAQSVVRDIIESYLDSGFEYVLGDDVKIGTIDQDILYIQLNSFDPAYDSGQDAYNAYLSILDEALTSQASMKAAIVDVRLNESGGSDALALRAASRFTDRIRPAFMEQGLGPEGTGPLDSFNIAPEGTTQFNGPVVVLTSAVTTSAAENFALNMLALPQVTVIGESTRGALSTFMGKRLLNGFEFFLPYEMEMTPDGRLFEKVGILPHVTADNFSDVDLVARRDSALEAAITALSD